MTTKPKVNSESQRELDKIEAQFDAFENQVKDLTMDRMNMAPKEEVEPQTKISSRDLSKKPDIYLKPEKRIADNQKFNERLRDKWNFAKEYVQFIAEHKEIIGETIEIWTHPFGGMGAEFWKVPTNKPVWGPRYLAEQIKKRSYHRLRMDQNIAQGGDSTAQYYGAMVVDTVVQRLDAHPVTPRRSIFMGANG